LRSRRLPASLASSAGNGRNFWARTILDLGYRTKARNWATQRGKPWANRPCGKQGMIIAAKQLKRPKAMRLGELESLWGASDRRGAPTSKPSWGPVCTDSRSLAVALLCSPWWGIARWHTFLVEAPRLGAQAALVERRQLKSCGRTAGRVVERTPLVAYQQLLPLAAESGASRAGVTRFGGQNSPTRETVAGCPGTTWARVLAAAATRTMNVGSAGHPACELGRSIAPWCWSGHARARWNRASPAALTRCGGDHHIGAPKSAGWAAVSDLAGEVRIHRGDAARWLVVDPAGVPA